MSKKRPRTRQRSVVSKLLPTYWRSRLFRNTYTHNGRLVQVRAWCVKVQHLGRRRTFSLRSSDREGAAAEACRLYRQLISQGWANSAYGRVLPRSGAAGVGGGAIGERAHSAYWAPPLVRREYTMRIRARPAPEFSVRIEEGGLSCYFPLNTVRREEAARRAARIYRVVKEHGWEATNLRFPRELTLGFRWLDRPQAWTYMTIHTQVKAARRNLEGSAAESREGVPVGIAEPDLGVRQALAWCLERMEGFVCAAAYDSLTALLAHCRERPVQVVLSNSSQAQNPAALRLHMLRWQSRAVAVLPYAAYVDSEELFRRTPGGAGTYLLRRTAANGFLEPLQRLPYPGQFEEQQIVTAVQQYFQSEVAGVPAGRLAHPLARLTQREHEVLALLSKGDPDKQIAQLLAISTHTVHEHVRNIFEKLEVHNRTEAVVKFLQK